MELEWKWISTVEIGLKEEALISHHSNFYNISCIYAMDIQIAKLMLI